jgi:hypothetical protein
MLLENIDNKYIKVDSEILVNGRTIQITVQKNCCDNQIYTDSIVWNTTNYTPTSKGTVRVGSELYISHKLFDPGSEEIEDGIYYVTLVAGSERNEGIIFYENKIRCMLAERLSEYLKIDKKDKHTELHMLHWAIFISQECLCMHQELCELFWILWSSLTNSKTSDCEC